MNATNFIQKARIDLEKIDNKHNAEPHFVFSNSNANELFVIVRAMDSDLKNEWRIQTYGI